MNMPFLNGIFKVLIHGDNDSYWKFYFLSPTIALNI